MRLILFNDSFFYFPMETSEQCLIWPTSRWRWLECLSNKLCLKELGLSLVLRANVIVLPGEGFIRCLAPESRAACFPRVLCFRLSERRNLCSVLAVFAQVSLSICHFSVALNKPLNPRNNQGHPFIGYSVWTHASYTHTLAFIDQYPHKHRRT